MLKKNLLLSVAAIAATTTLAGEASAKTKHARTKHNVAQTDSSVPKADPFSCPDLSGLYKSQKSGQDVKVIAQLGNSVTYKIGNDLEINADGAEHAVTGANAQAGLTYSASCNGQTITLEFKKDGKSAGAGSIVADTTSNLHISLNGPGSISAASDDLIRQGAVDSTAPDAGKPTEPTTPPVINGGNSQTPAPTEPPTDENQGQTKKKKGHKKGGHGKKSDDGDNGNDDGDNGNDDGDNGNDDGDNGNGNDDGDNGNGNDDSDS